LWKPVNARVTLSPALRYKIAALVHQVEVEPQSASVLKFQFLKLMLNFGVY